MAQSSGRVTPGVAATGFLFPRAQRCFIAVGRALSSGRQVLVYYSALAIFALSCLLWGLVAAILQPLLPRRLGQPVGQFLVMAGFRYLVALLRFAGIIKCDLDALDALRDRAPLVIAANHPTQLDVMLIVSRLPRVVCAAKADLLSHPLFGASARLAGYIRNDAPVHFVREAVRQLRTGRQLLIFPEGTRSDDRIGPFKSGFALIAEQAEAPIQMVFIDGDTRFLAKGWSFLRMPDFPLTYRVRLGPSFAVTGDRRDFVVGLRRSYCREFEGGYS